MTLTGRVWPGAMRVDDWSTLTERLDAHMAGVRRIFNELIGDEK